MTHNVLAGLASVLVLGIAAQWIAWRLKLPSILILLVVGFIAGPITGFLHPDELLGDILFPLVSVSVAIIMFEGALGLKLADLRQTGRAIRNLLTIGAGITWVLSTLGARFILGLDWSLAILIGGVLIVTGPTVIGPLLRHVRPVGPVGPILRWEGILIDPVGATLALLIFEALIASGPLEATRSTVVGVTLTLVVGGVIGALGAVALYQLMKRYLVPDYLQNAVTLMIVVGVFALSDQFQHESGLLAVTVMGIILANQRSVPVKHIIEFKESVGVTLIASLFILLSARLDLVTLNTLGLEIVLFIVFLMVVVRPVSVVVSTLGSSLNWRERAFLAWMAPRGIVAAAVTSIFALRLTEAGFPEAERLVPIMFMVIVATVAIYGLTSLPVARWLGVARAGSPQGVLIVGAHGWGRAIASALKEAGYRVLLVDTNYANIQQARMDDLPVRYGSILDENGIEELNLDGIGRLLALTSNDEVNSLAVLHMTEIFGRAEVYQLPLQRKDKLPDAHVPNHLRGRILFQPNATFQYLDELYNAGAVVKATPLTREFDYRAFQNRYGTSAVPMFLVDEATGALSVFATDRSLTPTPGQTVISMVMQADPTLAATATPRAEPVPAEG